MEHRIEQGALELSVAWRAAPARLFGKLGRSTAGRPGWQTLRAPPLFRASGVSCDRGLHAQARDPPRAVLRGT